MSSAFKRHRDHFAIDFDEAALRVRVSNLRREAISDDEVRNLYQLS